jgi:hypothetical protein
MSDIDLENAISQFYEDESLTDALTDQPANTLLTWGEKQLGELAKKSASTDEFDTQFTQLRKLIKSMSRFVAEHQDMAEDEQAESVQKIMGFAQGAGIPINNTAEAIVAEQKSLADEGSVAHLLAQFASSLSEITNTPPVSGTPTTSTPVEPDSAFLQSHDNSDSAFLQSPDDSDSAFMNSPVEDVTEILPKGGLMDFIKKITSTVTDAHQKERRIYQTALHRRL